MNQPVLRTHALTARDEQGGIYGLELALPAGPVGALLGTPSDGSSALAKTLAGLLRPTMGSVLIAGKNPHQSPQLRRSLGVLMPDANLADVGYVRELIAFARGLRGTEAPRHSWYEPLGIDSLAPRQVASLNPREARTVALALALAVASPTALILFDPLAADVTAHTLRPLLKEKAEQGACLLVITPSVQDAIALCDDMATLERGRIGRALGQPDVDVLVPGMPAELRVWCDHPRRLLSALSLAAEVKSLSWTEMHEGGMVLVRCSGAESCAKTIAKAALQTGVEVRAIQQTIPGTPEVYAASAGIMLAKHHQAAYAATVAEERS
ncbi:MAG TPA: ATP-binding cassette domain-containing protein [Polyangiaceae bacterium]|jgi:ABC-type multidrug transport system ATPase subunit|nr:MAG: Sulfate/thiosulfate import ATP-binding protein CysA [Deltaproteobacteria bacterium ADurb.Bin207]HNT00336.1 ATP-binding cassette domain-containing protein [Polyangiaceae bacterium]HNZ22071.1 ATP-binding cassette domain-containing protein [Polyangiaceae bacterium]HOD22174.1 ATP-binding cassette domain-containing protein [Polyangiaceae bacterium]HOE47379.1 ATP-binding cassette domain-containing protein [Polyangiaceae bacterium]